VAAALGIPEVIVPAYPGITSAVGLLTTDLKYDSIRTEFMDQRARDPERLGSDFESMQGDLQAQFLADGLGPDEVTFLRAGDLRYVGQGYELRVAFPDRAITRDALEDVFAAFHEQHRKEYGHVFEDSPIEIVNIRITGVGRMPKIRPGSAGDGGSLTAAQTRTASTLFRVDGSLQRVETPFYRRDALPVGEAFDGPAIILQKDTTTVVPPNASVRMEENGNMLIRLGG
jgi:N-methylhydantoinase A